MYRYILILIFSLLLSSCSWNTPDQLSTTGTGDEIPSYRASLDDDERVALAKKRKTYITGIRKGDFYSLRNAPEEALNYYLQIQEKLPNDQVVRKKTAHVFYLIKNWSRAYAEYIKVPISELQPDEMNELLHALFFDEDFYDRLGELSKLTLPPDTLEYYELVDTCYTGVENCANSLSAYTGSESRILDLKNQLQSAKKITSDSQYRNLLIASKFYEQSMYRATSKILQEILEERPDYIEVKKMLGFSLFELGKYEEAKKYILEYLDKNPRDLDSIVSLGELYFSLGDYVSSNLYLNNAIIAGYLPKMNLERRLAYNYSLLGDVVGMMKVLSYLLESDEATEDDFAVGISVAIDEGEYDRAVQWAKKGLALYEDSNYIVPLYVQVLRLQGEIDNASALVQNTSEEAMMENPNFLLEKAILYYELGDIDTAKDIFENLLALADWPDITEEARVYLGRINASDSIF